MTKIKLILTLLILSVMNMSFASSTKGSEFWLVFSPNLSDNEITLFISSETQASGTIEMQGQPAQPFNVSPSSGEEISIPRTMISEGGLNTNHSVHINSDVQISVYALNKRQYSTDAYTAIPISSLGKEYYNVAYNPYTAQFPDQINILATENNTTVDVTFPDSTTQSISLNQGENFLINNRGLADLTGSHILSNNLIFVTGGAQCTTVPAGSSACDNLVESLLPVSSLGTAYIAHPLATRTKGDTFRIVATVDNTEISINGSIVSTINAGEFYEHTPTSTPEKLFIEGNQPILVAQYSNGTSVDGVYSDPFMMTLYPNSQFTNNYFISTSDLGSPDKHFVNIVVPTVDKGELLIDGAPIAATNFSPVPGTSYSSLDMSVTEGIHAFTSTTGNVRFALYVYGFADFDSYGYPGGMQMSPLNKVLKLSITPLVDTETVNQQNCSVIKLIDTDTNAPVPTTLIDIEVSGVNSITTSKATDSNGEINYCYTSTIEGSDTITVKTGTLSESATRNWTLVKKVLKLSITPPVDTQVVNQQNCSVIKLIDTNTNTPVAATAIDIDIEVSGVNSVTTSGTTDSNGEINYCYTSSIDGSDTITVKLAH